MFNIFFYMYMDRVSAIKIYILLLLLLRCYSFMELITYINAQYCSAHFIYLFPRLHVSCNLSPINNDRKHAISAIFISVFF